MIRKQAYELAHRIANSRKFEFTDYLQISNHGPYSNYEMELIHKHSQYSATCNNVAEYLETIAGVRFDKAIFMSICYGELRKEIQKT